VAVGRFRGGPRCLRGGPSPPDPHELWFGGLVCGRGLVGGRWPLSRWPAVSSRGAEPPGPPRVVVRWVGLWPLVAGWPLAIWAGARGVFVGAEPRGPHELWFGGLVCGRGLVVVSLWSFRPGPLRLGWVGVCALRGYPAVFAGTCGRSPSANAGAWRRRPQGAKCRERVRWLVRKRWPRPAQSRKCWRRMTRSPAPGRRNGGPPSVPPRWPSRRLPRSAGVLYRS